jgi:hypothetical protein
MKVILSVPDEGYSKNMSCSLNLISTFLYMKISFKKCVIFYIFKFLSFFT